MSIISNLQPANVPLVRKSYDDAFLGVGLLRGYGQYRGYCTATWLGEDGRWAYFMTAAHCLSNYSILLAGEDMTSDPDAFHSLRKVRYKDVFIGWNGKIIASGKGYAYFPEEYSQNGGSRKADIAIIKLPAKRDIVDYKGAPIAPPIIDDQGEVTEGLVQFVGYGLWGAGLDLESLKSLYQRKFENRRMYGESWISPSLFPSSEPDLWIRAAYEHEKWPTRYWAMLASRDSGAAWWQSVNGKLVITGVAIRADILDEGTTAVRTSGFSRWIKSIFKEVRLQSETFYKRGEVNSCDNRPLHQGDIYIDHTDSLLGTRFF
ncbi:MAG: hypothetical protein ACPG5T_09965, partial [Endozoicomonas sp.]